MLDTSPIDWPVLVLGKQRLVIRWTFYAQWLLSKRKVNVKDLPILMKGKDVTLLDTMVECFAAAVAENFTSQDLPAPSAEYWAAAISGAGDPELWARINRLIWEAVGKAPAAPTPPTAQDPAQGITTQ